ncbi:dTDP-4-dehydrorhamnose 3,5-epimerase family protein [Phenylobacterium kunshanense]|uniref:dTDP-4-dehydrorhamnose 3,5-epimerase n=1 Tax=Phenylobacterium kunshanense TaxID=1445034 RepID=A0A328BKS3_9CAUL|nr:dTDP-4-dehydrorhamnose 3,5-epimerase family protein [Phenylobacterium kunshanense]RAK66586.1 hypothetical protein DJ019_10140 [Phenylobacterium kunshanense]
MNYPTAREALSRSLPLPKDIRILELKDHGDERGVFREIFRTPWAAGPVPMQWNMAWSKPGVLRGVHVHPSHVDHLTVAIGEMILGLHDFRPDSPTAGLSAMLRLQGDDPHLVEIPTGVAHGFYFPVASMHVYGVSRLYAGPDDFACRWNDPELKFAWPTEAPILSDRDRAAGSYRALAERLVAQAAA